MGTDIQKTTQPDNATRERIYTPAEHERHYAPLNRELHAEDAKQFGWTAENGTVQSYRNTSTQRHIHIDGLTRQFYDQQMNPITQQTALDRAMGAGQHHATEPTVTNQVSQAPVARTNDQGFSL